MSEKYPLVILAVILGVSAFLMLGAAKTDAPIMDELAHIPAGYSYVRFLDYRLNPEHPPLLKALSGIPLLFLHLNFPTTEKSWVSDVNGQWDAGTEFFYQSGNDPNEIVFYARLFPILLTLFTALLIYFWGRELVGKVWALIPAGLFALSPNILAHGHYVTTDVAATFGTVAATYAFTTLLLKRSRGALLLSGLALGAAELLKFSNVLLIPFFFFLVLVAWIAEMVRSRKTENFRLAVKKWKSYLFLLVATFLIAYAFVYLVYLLFTWNYPIARQISDTSQILQSFSMPWLSSTVISFTHSAVLRPLAQYALGVCMVLQRSTGGNTAYFLGQLASTGWWYYFPVVFLAKETLPALLLIATGFFAALYRLFKNPEGKHGFLRRTADYLGTNFQEFAMLIFVVFYWGYSIHTNLNIGIRHLFPTFPFVYLLATVSIKKTLKASWLKTILIVLVLLWVAVETSIATPNFLSYFNEIGGGKWNGYRVVTDSNYDWGQDELRLAALVKEKEQDGTITGKIAVDYFGAGSPEFSLGDIAVPWNSAKGNPKDHGIDWLAVSVNSLSQAMARPTNGFVESPLDTYPYLRSRVPNFVPGSGTVPPPDLRAGTSIFIFHLTK